METARAEWAACAPLLAGIAKVRIGTWASRDRLVYLDRDERPLTKVRPSKPAAIRVYGVDGCCVALCLDLDASKVGADQVDVDAARLTTWFAVRGVRVLEDASPSGGRHLYAPFSVRIPYAAAREVVEALAAGCPSLDPGPHRSVRTGCIRAPGSAHKGGGAQRLVTPLATAYDALRRPASATAFEVVRRDLHEEIEAWRRRQTTHDVDPDDGVETTTPRSIARRLRAIAETGVYDQARYPSASEARQAVVAGAARAGWTLADVAVRVRDGRWPGLASFYARYSPGHRRPSLDRDWLNAVAFTGEQAKQARSSPENLRHRSHTSQPRSHAGQSRPGLALAEHQYVRAWLTVLRVMEIHRLPGRRHHLARFILRALGEAAHKVGDRRVQFGVRSLALACGAEYSSVAAVLRMLAAMDDPWLDLVERGRGEHADLYELRIPDSLADEAAELRWDAGMVHSLRPAFRALGYSAAFVFEAVESGRAGSITDLVPATGLSRTKVTDAVEMLVGYGLLERVEGALVAQPGRLNAVAELVGAIDAVVIQHRRYVRDRAAWRAFLARHEPDQPDLEYVDDDYWPPGELDPGGTLLSLVA